MDHKNKTSDVGVLMYVRLEEPKNQVEEVPMKISEDQVSLKIHSKAGALKDTIMEFRL